METIYTVDKILKTTGMTLSELSQLSNLSETRLKELALNKESPTENELKHILNAVSRHYRTPKKLDTLEDVYNNLLDQIAATLKENIDKLAHKFLPDFDAYISHLYREARNAILLNLHTAALANLFILLEYILKDLIQDNLDKSPDSVQALKAEKIDEKLSLGESIKEAFKRGLLTEDEKKSLEWINIWMRNPLIHSKFVKITEKDTCSNVQTTHLQTGKSEIVDLNGADHKFFRKISRIKRDEEDAWPFFLWVENFIATKYYEVIQQAIDGNLGVMFLVENGV